MIHPKSCSTRNHNWQSQNTDLDLPNPKANPPFIHQLKGGRDLEKEGPVSTSHLLYQVTKPPPSGSGTELRELTISKETQG